jgi:hypothetical protein
MFVLHVLPSDLEPGFVRLGTRVDEIRVVAAAHEGVDLFRQRGRRYVHCRVREIGKLPHLVGGDIGKLSAAIADIDAPQPSHSVEILGAVSVDDRRTVAPGNHHLFGFQHFVLNDRVQDVIQILPHDRLANRGIGRVRKRHHGPRG